MRNVYIFRFWGKCLKRVVRIFTGKVIHFSENGPKCKNLEKLDIFGPGPAFGSATPGPNSALYPCEEEVV